MESLEARLARVEQELKDLQQEYQSVMYAVTHDLSAPLRSIQGFSTLLRERGLSLLDDKQLKYLAGIVVGSQTMKRILDELLQYSRLDRSHESIRKCDLNLALEKAIKRITSKIESSQAHIQIEVLPWVFADSDLLVQLFICLLENALLYQKQGNIPNISVACEEHENHWQFSVKDNGIGIRKRVQERIFIVLNRAVGAKEYPGMGMGLAIAQKIVLRHHGKIWLESAPNKGSCFYFTLSKHLSEDLSQG